MSLLTITDKIRNQISPGLNSVTKSRLGQFLTPSPIAGFMASLFSQLGFENIRLLDGGAGLGALSHAFLDRLRNENFDLKYLEITAYELTTSFVRNWNSCLRVMPQRHI